jgi:hypothetical protein
MEERRQTDTRSRVLKGKKVLRAQVIGLTQENRKDQVEGERTVGGRESISNRVQAGVKNLGFMLYEKGRL